MTRVSISFQDHRTGPFNDIALSHKRGILKFMGRRPILITGLTLAVMWGESLVLFVAWGESLLHTAVQGKTRYESAVLSVKECESPEVSHYSHHGTSAQ